VAQTVAAARAAGFTNLNLDLIFAIPGQTLAGWGETLRRAVNLGPEHLSCYCLTYEPGTRLTRLRDEGRIRPGDEESEAEMFEAAIDLLTAAGYEHYEISNFARPGRRCQANMIYWENREYLGIGPSAVSYLDGVRSRNVADVRRYIDLMRTDPAAVVVEQERLDDLRRAGETAIQMLRLTEGIDVEKFRRMTGCEPHRLFARQIREFGELGLLAATPQSIRLTRRGMVVANRIMAEMLPDAPAGRAAT
jgi:oxygen-independent coproporphyrinogen-3 oxidase